MMTSFVLFAVVCLISPQTFAVPVKNDSSDGTKTPTLFDTYSCGRQSLEDTLQYEFPWFGFITAFGWNLCSVTLINARYVLTAAVCTLSTELTVVRFLDFNFKRNITNLTEAAGPLTDLVHFDDFDIEAAIPHPLFNISDPSNFFKHNIGLLRLNQTVVYKDHIRPICLSNIENIIYKPGDMFYVCGVNILYDPEIGRERVKKKIRTILLSREECKEKFKSCNATEFTLPDDNTCLLEGTKNTEYEYAQFGENGGPVMSLRNNQWQMEGVQVFTRYDCMVPIVYIKIIDYLTWIESTMKP